MKKTQISKRLLSLLCALTLVITMIPGSVYAAIGDKENVGSGLVNNKFTTDRNPVNLPIKIYDYLNDGMLFEYAEAQNMYSMKGGYAGGTAFPNMDGVIGTDYTGANRYNNAGSIDNDPFEWFAWTYLGQTGAYGTTRDSNDNEVYYSQMGSIDKVEPQHLHMEYLTNTTTRSYTWIQNFARDNGDYPSGNEMRYAVVVYRTNDTYATNAPTGKTAAWRLSVDTANYVSGNTKDISSLTYYTAAQDTVKYKPSTEWTYVVQDLRQVNSGNTTNQLVDDTNWATTNAGTGRVAGVMLGMPLTRVGEEMDISHICFFPTQEEAEAFGEKAAAFDKDPGVDLTKYYGHNTQSHASERQPIVDIGLDFTTQAYQNDFAAYSLTTGSNCWTSTVVSSVSKQRDGNLRFARVANSDPYTRDYGLFFSFAGDEDHGWTWNGYYNNRPIEKWRVRYLCLVYKSSGCSSAIGFVEESTGSSGHYDFTFSNKSDWGYVVYDLSKLSTWSSDASITHLGIKWPGLNASAVLDFSHIAFFPTEDAAKTFGAKAVAFDNDPGYYFDGGRGWNMGNNRAYGLLRGSNGGDITSSGLTNTRGNTMANTYNNTAIGSDYLVGDTSGVANTYFLNLWTWDSSYNFVTESFDMSKLAFDGYKLYGTVSNTLDKDNVTIARSLFTAGLLEGTLGADKTPQYRQETVDYLAKLLQRTLCIGEVNSGVSLNSDAQKEVKNEYFNYNYVKGTESLDYAVTDGVACDLATALRAAIGTKEITSYTDSDLSGVDHGYGSSYPWKVLYNLGTWAATTAKKDQLIGPWQEVKANVTTCYDAAYYLLQNLFVSNSYNEAQEDFSYLTLQPAQVVNPNGKTVDTYVFDAGYTQGTGLNAGSAVIYNTTKDTISNLAGSNGTVGKLYYEHNDGSSTTYYPFLPIYGTNNQAGQTTSMYWAEPGYSAVAYHHRNFNYVMAVNGEFQYNEDDDLFFDFEGDDDVYLFINGQLVLDIGGAHSIAKYRMEVNDYVNAARTAVANGSTNERDLALALVDGETYDFDFYYMERHAFGANMRISTNMRVVDPALGVDKTAYQDGAEINYGGVVNGDEIIEYGFAATNTGNSKLYNLSFSDPNIGVTLDPEQGLVVSGSNVTNLSGGPLQASDLVAYVDGYYDWNNLVPTEPIPTLTITFADNTELIAFLKKLQASSTDATDSGLWPHARVQIRGIGYKMTDQQVVDKVFNNTVTVEANTEGDGSGKTLYGEDSMRVMIAGDLVFYQWAGHTMQVYENGYLKTLITAAASAENSSLPATLKTINAINGVNIVSANGTVISTTRDSNVYYQKDQITVGDKRYEGRRLCFNYKEPGTYNFYISINYNATSGGDYSYSEPIPIQVCVTDVQDSVFVLDYGLKADLTQNDTLFVNDSITVPGRDTYHTLMGIASSASEPSYVDTEPEYFLDKAIRPDGNYTTSFIDFDADSDGRIEASREGLFWLESGEKLTYTPRRFLDTAGSIYLAVAVCEEGVDTPTLPTKSDWTDESTGTVYTHFEHNTCLLVDQEVHMYKKVTVVPANVIYYEDNFDDHKASGSATGSITYNKIEGNFTQISGTGDVLQNVDQSQEYGQDDAYQSSTNTQYSGGSLTTIKITDTSTVASYTFRGTGMEIIARTNAYDSATIMVTIKAAETIYDTDGTTVLFAEGETVQSIPVITQFDNGNDGGKDAIYQVPVIRVKDLTYGTYTASIMGFPTYDVSQGTGNAPMIDTYLYLDGIRIFDPLGPDGSEYYIDTEQGVTFCEIRDLIVNGQISFTTYDGSDVTFSTAFTTWTENLHGKYEGNSVGSANDYLLVGPNNEVYVDGDVTDSALFFKVKKAADVTVTSFQVAVRALDSGLYYGSDSTGMSSSIEYCVKDGDTYSWMPLATVKSGTEQYYSLDVNKCPTDENGYYMLAVRVTSGMASFTSLKYKGLDIQTVNGDAATLVMYNGILYQECLDENGDQTLSEVDESEYISFATVSSMMRADTISQTPEETEPVVIPTLTPSFPSVALEEEVKYNIYFTVSDIANVAELGLVAFDSALSDAMITDAVQVFSGYAFDGTCYMVGTDGIAAKNMGDTMYFKIYAKLTDGSYAYSSLFHFSAVDYVKSVLASGAYADGLKQTCVALMNYGADAQIYFGYNTENLMNSFLTEDQLAMVGGYDSSMVSALVKADSSKIGSFAAVSGGFSAVEPALVLEGAFAINCYYTPAHAVDDSVVLYYWDEAAYNGADVLTAENATGILNAEEVDGKYLATVSGIAAKELDDTIYIAAIYESNGTTYCTGVLAVSVNALGLCQMGITDSLTDLCRSMIVYGDYAKAYFG